jgi:hypothetical protein
VLLHLLGLHLEKLNFLMLLQLLLHHHLLQQVHHQMVLKKLLHLDYLAEVKRKECYLLQLRFH